MNLSGKRVVVVGLAQTGIAVARFVHRRGARVVSTDGKAEDKLADDALALREIGELYAGGISDEALAGADLVVMSPGVPRLPPIARAIERGIPVIAEIELAYRFFDDEATLIAITGTNGKSTTTALTGHLCAGGDRPSFCGGNLGNHPLIEAVDHPANTAGGIIVAEVAGFMLENCDGFRPKVAACLNITEDHLDRFGTMEHYAAVKNRIYRWQQADDYAIANALDPRVLEGARQESGQLFTFGAETERGAFATDTEIVLRGDWGEEGYEIDALPIVGSHNVQNAEVAFLAARLAGISPEQIRERAPSFLPQPHRMERVVETNGIVFYDDSKGTNVAAVAASLHGFPRRFVLIAGGVDKGGSYQPMFEAIADSCLGLVLIGEAAGLIAKAAAEYAPKLAVDIASSMDEAVSVAAARARSGDAVVLSPACSSYDMFNNFGERGEAFQRAARAWRRPD